MSPTSPWEWTIEKSQRSTRYMSDLAGLQRPEDAEAGAEGGHGQVANVAAGELERAVVADFGLGVPVDISCALWYLASQPTFPLV